MKVYYILSYKTFSLHFIVRVLKRKGQKYRVSLLLNYALSLPKEQLGLIKYLNFE